MRHWLQCNFQTSDVVNDQKRTSPHGDASSELTISSLYFAISISDSHFSVSMAFPNKYGSKSGLFVFKEAICRSDLRVGRIMFPRLPDDGSFDLKKESLTRLRGTSHVVNRPDGI